MAGRVVVQGVGDEGFGVGCLVEAHLGVWHGAHLEEPGDAVAAGLEDAAQLVGADGDVLGGVLGSRRVRRRVDGRGG
jgi:hypothetical protein